MILVTIVEGERAGEDNNSNSKKNKPQGGANVCSCVYRHKLNSSIRINCTISCPKKSFSGLNEAGLA